MIRLDNNLIVDIIAIPYIFLILEFVFAERIKHVSIIISIFFQFDI